MSHSKSHVVVSVRNRFSKTSWPLDAFIHQIGNFVASLEFNKNFDYNSNLIQDKQQRERRK